MICSKILTLFLCMTLLSGCGEAPVPPASPAAPQSLPASAPVLPELDPEAEPRPEPAPAPEPEPEPAPAPQSEPGPEPAPDPPASKNTKLYILMYHHFVTGDGTGCNPWTLPIDRFREDLQWLADHGYTTVLPSQLAAGEPLPERAVLITMDDGYDSNYQLAYPVLQEFGAKAVISIITHHLQSRDPAYLSWDKCREMMESGLVEFGSHTYRLHTDSPVGVKRLSGESQAEYEARVFPDIEVSILQMEENLGVRPQFFAYPGGVTDSWVKAFIREHFSISVTTQHGPADISGGLYNLRRHNVSVEEDVAKFLPD